ncbi:hypothetical protein E4J89_19090 [Arthrobacter sp. CAU 1506]|nr:hypothetical protein E4J89_19090 [Arthrobacter sp. CAU 1506]
MVSGLIFSWRFWPYFRSASTSSPHLEKAVSDAVTNSMDSHYNLSLQALGDKTKMHALLQVLSELVYEELQG